MSEINTFLRKMLDGQEAVRKATARVEWENDPKMPGRTAYRIRGLTREIVQGAIASRVAFAEENGGRATFLGPHRIDEGWGALGEVVITPPAAAE